MKISMLEQDMIDCFIKRAMDLKDTIIIFGYDKTYECYKEFLKLFELTNKQYEEAIKLGNDILEDGLNDNI